MFSNGILVLLNVALFVKHGMKNRLEWFICLNINMIKQLLNLPL